MTLIIIQLGRVLYYTWFRSARIGLGLVLWLPRLIWFGRNCHRSSSCCCGPSEGHSGRLRAALARRLACLVGRVGQGRGVAALAGRLAVGRRGHEGLGEGRLGGRWPCGCRRPGRGLGGRGGRGRVEAAGRGQGCGGREQRWVIAI